MITCYRCNREYVNGACGCRDGITLVHGDCRVVLPQLSDGFAVVSDPPYGIAYSHGGGKRGGKVKITKAVEKRGTPPIVGDDTPFNPCHLMRFDEILIWGADHYYPRLPDSGRWLAWNKLGDMEPWDSFADVEFAWHSLEGAARIFSMKWKGIACDKAGEDNGRRFHPTQKPLRLMRWCVCQVKSHGSILDPYAGSGTTLVAAKDLGRRCIGIEIEEKYCEIAAKRLQQEVLAFTD